MNYSAVNTNVRSGNSDVTTINVYQMVGKPFFAGNHYLCPPPPPPPPTSKGEGGHTGFSADHRVGICVGVGVTDFCTHDIS